MKLTIIPSDGAVYVDGLCISGLDFPYPKNVHAVQWDGEKGWIEFMSNAEFIKPQNEYIDELPIWVVVAKQKWSEAQ